MGVHQITTLFVVGVLQFHQLERLPNERIPGNKKVRIEKLELFGRNSLLI